LSLKTTDDQIDGRRHGGGIICLVEIIYPLFASADPRKKIYTHMVFDPHQKPTLVMSGGCAQWLHSSKITQISLNESAASCS